MTLDDILSRDKLAPRDNVYKEDLEEVIVEDEPKPEKKEEVELTTESILFGKNIEEETRVDMVSNGEAFGKNAVIGVTDFLNILLPEDLEIGMEEWREQVENSIELNPVMVEKLIMETGKYVSDAFVATRVIKTLSATKKGAEFIAKHGNNIATWMGAGELEFAISAGVHEEEYIPLVGAATGGLLKSGQVAGKKLKDFLADSEFKHLNPNEHIDTVKTEVKQSKPEAEDIPKSKTEEFFNQEKEESLNLERIIEMRKTLPEQKLENDSASELAEDVIKESDYKQMLKHQETSTQIEHSVITESKEFAKHKPVYDKIKDSLGNTKVYVSDIEEKFDGGVLGYYDRNTDTIMLSKNLDADTALHEFIHASIERQIISNKDISTKLVDVFNQAKKEINVDGQWKKDEHEFLSEVFSNDKLRNKVIEHEPTKNIFKKFIKGVFGNKNLDIQKEVEDILFNGTKKDIDINKVAKHSESKKLKEQSLKESIDEHGIIYLGAKHIDRKLQKNQFYMKGRQAITESDFGQKIAFNIEVGSKNIHSKVDELLTKNTNLDKKINEMSKAYKGEIKKALKAFSEEEEKDLTKSIVYSGLTETMLGKNKNILLDTLDKNLENLDEVIDSFQKNMTDKQITAIDKTSKFSIYGKNDTELITNADMLAKKHKLDKDDVETLITLKSLKEVDNTALNKLYKDKKNFNRIIETQMANVRNSEKIFSKEESHRKMQGYSRDTYGQNKKEFTVVSKKEAQDLLDDTSAQWVKHKDISKKEVMLVRKDLSQEFRHGVIPIQKQTVSGALHFSPKEAKQLGARNMKNKVDSVVGKDNAIPVYNKNGDVVNYRTMMSKAEKREVLDLDERISTVITDTAGSILRKESSGAIQTDAYKALVGSGKGKIDLDSTKSIMFDDVKHLSELPVNIRSKYRVLTQKEREILPPDFKNVNIIRKDASDVILGYHEFFVSSEANRRARYMEKVFKGAVQEFKKNVVIKYPVVLMNNELSNNAILMMHMDRPADFAKLSAYKLDAFKLLEGFKKMAKKKEYYQLKVDAGNTRYEKRLQQVQESMKKHPIYEAEQQGFIQSITDEVFLEGMETDNLFSKELGRLSKEHMPDKIKQILDKKKYKGMPLKKALKEIYMTEDSASFSVMAGMMQKSDYASRWALYKFSKDKGMSKEKARKLANDMFIDYRKNLPKELQAASEYGVIPFATFFFRSHVAMTKLANKNPTKVGLSIVLANTLLNTEGSGVRTDSWNIYNSFLDSNAVQLNPMSEQMLVPMHLDIMKDSLTDPINLTRAVGFTVQ